MNTAGWEDRQVRIGVRLAFDRFWEWTLVLLVVWMLAAAVIFWMSLSPMGHENLSVWLWSSTVGKVCSWCQVTYNGQMVNTGDMARWLNVAIYKSSLLEAIKEALWVGLVPTALWATALLLHALWPLESQTHVRGTEVMSTQALQRRLMSWWRRKGIAVAGVTIPRADERSHLTICGATGAGKTMSIRDLLQQIERRGETAIIFDPAQELTQEFFNPARGDWVLNPLDVRCPQVSPWTEIEYPKDAPAVAESLIPDLGVRPASGAEWFFRESARKLFIVLLERVTTKNPLDIIRLLSSPDKLDAVIKGTEAAALLVEDAHGQRGGIIATLMNAVAAFAFLPTAAAREWSAREWVQHRQGWIFFTFRSNDKKAALPLVSMWFDCLLRRLLDGPLYPKETTWAVNDEVATLQRLPHLEDAVTKGRKHGLALVLGFHAYTQIEVTYGEKVASTILAAPATKLLLGTGDPHTAEWCSRVIDSREVARPKDSISVGQEDGRNSFNRTIDQREERAVLSAEFQQLEPRHGFLCTRKGVAAVEVPVRPLRSRQPGVIPRGNPEMKVQQPVPPLPSQPKKKPKKEWMF